jgi:hypothetical protein
MSGGAVLPGNFGNVLKTHAAFDPFRLQSAKIYGAMYSALHSGVNREPLLC